ncbi:MAG: type II secretion system protein [Firmicutes bacterium]|nr:type II secretion system protein [Bacillota bacterium]
MKKNKKNQKGFSLIELLAVIVIMGILMLVGIPAVKKYVTNSKKDVYVNAVQTYVKATKTAFENEDLTCSDTLKGNYFIYFSQLDSVMEDKAKSPFTKKGMNGMIIFSVNDGKISDDGIKVAVRDDSGIGFARCAYVSVTRKSLAKYVSTGQIYADYGYTECKVR